MEFRIRLTRALGAALQLIDEELNALSDHLVNFAFGTSS